MNIEVIIGLEKGEILEIVYELNFGIVNIEFVGKVKNDGSCNKEDYYKIIFLEISELNLNLDNFWKNVDLKLLESDGSIVVVDLINIGRDSEFISEVLNVGEYFVLVEIKS